MPDLLGYRTAASQGWPSSLKEMGLTLPNLSLAHDLEGFPANLLLLRLTAALGGFGLRVSPCSCSRCAYSFWGTVEALHLSGGNGMGEVILRCSNRLAAREPVALLWASMRIYLEHMLPAMRSCTCLMLSTPTVALCYSSAGAGAPPADPPDQPATLRFLRRLVWVLASRTQLRELVIEAEEVILASVPADPASWLRLRPDPLSAFGLQMDCGHSFTATCRLILGGHLLVQVRHAPS